MRDDKPIDTKSAEFDGLSVDPKDYGGAEVDVDLSTLTCAQIVTAIQRNISCISFCHARVIALIDEVERRGLWAEWVGVKTLTEWVMHVASVTMHTAREYVRVTAALREMPKVKKGLADGDISFSKVREVTRLGERIGDDEALRLATLATGSQISRISQNYQQLAGKIDNGPFPLFLAQDSVSMRQVGPGRTRITIELEEDEAAEIATMIDAARQVLERPVSEAAEVDAGDGAENGVEGKTGGTEEAPYEPVSQAMCLMEIIRAFPRAAPAGSVDADRARLLVHASAEVITRSGATVEAAPAFEPPMVSIPARPATETGVPAGTETGTGVPAGAATVVEEDVPAGTPEGRADTTCRIEGFGGITAATAERLSCEALISGVIKDSGGDVLMLGRSKRLVSRRQRLALSVRDVCCQFPGCRTRRRCDAHHIRPWSQGGATDMDNLILLCRRHHTVVHKYQLRIERTDADFAGAMRGAAAFTFHLPDGAQLLPLESRVAGRRMFNTAIEVAEIKKATADADPGTTGGGYGFHLGLCIDWMFEAERQHAREKNAAA
ncbi:HNH endonuclease signature motif containing protein [Brevibacterium spongiae]|uniref:HNH endonuclease n=1 Tax=Brevibacterium spongiae TaxID=2909672 RepID=A0ABY5SMX0_9MICO|nr:HNH endonuclease signature motif containing protein [Brevibacterium spongiae]UVI34419.1 HNH endonuclease [Brevibacterium spongiae]